MQFVMLIYQGSTPVPAQKEVDSSGNGIRGTYLGEPTCSSQRPRSRPPVSSTTSAGSYPPPVALRSGPLARAMLPLQPTDQFTVASN